MSAIAAIHVARKQLGLDEDTYRAVLVRVTGKASTRDMSEPERNRVVEELRRQGFRPAPSKGVRKGLQGPFAGKLQALWIAAWNLGLVENRADAALVAFVRRQTGIEHMNWLRDPADAAKVIEALKGWMARDAGVDWSTASGMPAWRLSNGYRIASAQFWLLFRADPTLAQAGLISLPKLLASYDAGADLTRMTGADWQVAMNALGARIRRVKPS